MNTNTVCLDLEAYNNLLISNVEMNKAINKCNEMTTIIYNIINSEESNEAKLAFIANIIQNNVTIEKVAEEGDEVQNGNE